MIEQLTGQIREGRRELRDFVPTGDNGDEYRRLLARINNLMRARGDLRAARDAHRLAAGGTQPTGG